MTGRWWYVDDIRVSRELTADAITAGTLTGRTLQTAESGNDRVVINTTESSGGGSNSINFYDVSFSDSNPKVTISKNIGPSGSQQYGIALHKGVLSITDVTSINSDPWVGYPAGGATTYQTLFYDGETALNTNQTGGGILKVHAYTDPPDPEASIYYNDALEIKGLSHFYGEVSVKNILRFSSHYSYTKGIW